MTKVIAIDFDGTLFEYDGWKNSNHYGEPIDGAKEIVEKLRDKGFKIMIFTTRGNEKVVKEALEEYDIPYDYINENPHTPPEAEISDVKPPANYYIDDRAIAFKGDWKEVMEEIDRRESEEK
ncbi:MAG: hypothetical protein ACOCSJ_05590 [Candidatus Natronoplasma sp.]